jgi:hypothetical protein
MPKRTMRAQTYFSTAAGMPAIGAARNSERVGLRGGSAQSGHRRSSEPIGGQLCIPPYDVGRPALIVGSIASNPRPSAAI